MAIDKFTKERFEAVLPIHKVTGAKLWQERGFIGGQYEYEVQVSSNVLIKIFSSIDSSGYARDCGDDSIRFILIDANGEPLSNKLQNWVTRVPGWEARMTSMLRKLWEMGRKIAAPCARCNTQKKVFLCKHGPNKGRRFVKCMRCGAFEWIDAPKVKGVVA